MGQRKTPGPGDLSVERLRQASTVDSRPSGESEEVARTPCLTIIHHPHLRRIGERALLWSMSAGETVNVSRLEPELAPIGADGGVPLLDPHVSRRPLSLAREADGTIVLTRGAGSDVLANGEPVPVARRFSLGEVREGVLLELAGRVVVLLHEVAMAKREARLDLVGESDVLEDVRRAVGRVADLDVAVLLRGETGVGKERVAQAIHASSGRASSQMVAVNMAALTPTTAASELFGHARGAFTDAHQRHVGLFERATGGTLFLDEIGETPPDIQAMLLRTLETGKVLAVGDRTERTVDVRVIAATDADLEESTRSGAFRAALLHRLSGYEIRVPPLRQRREDIARLAVAFLESELATIGDQGRLDPPRGESSEPVWFPASLMARLYRCDWPGNVRQLRNVVRQIVISSRGQPTLHLDASVTALLDARTAPSKDRSRESSPEVSSPPPSAPPAPRPKVTEEQLLAALAAHGWAAGPTAAALGIPRSTLYDLIDGSTSIRKASEIGKEELAQSLAACGGDIDAMARTLLVSKRALQLRLRKLGLAGD